MDQLDPERRIELLLRDAMRVYSLLGELVAFFHSSRSQAETLRFIGTRDSGALAALFDAYYGSLRDILAHGRPRFFGGRCIRRQSRLLDATSSPVS